jgi:dTDP-glucose 4,6-dehydratase
VTGAAGFTGSWLCRALVGSGARVVAFVKPTTTLASIDDVKADCQIVHGDLLDPQSLVRAFKGVDIVFNSAAVVPLEDNSVGPETTIQVNGLGAFNAAVAARRCGVSLFVQVSTPHVYGNKTGSDLPLRESVVPTPLGVYAISKYTGDLLVKSQFDEGLPVIWTRGFSKYGPGQDTNFFIGKVIAHLLDGSAVTLGNPNPTRDYTFVSDVVRGYLLAAEKGKPGETYHFGWGEERTARAAFAAILRVMEVNDHEASRVVTWSGVTRRHEVARQVGNSSKSCVELGWRPEVPFEEGLRRTVDWWRSRVLNKRT